MQHLDEGTIHTWLDGQLPPAQAEAVFAHVAECRPCADAVAEARGLIAASSRILTMLDGVPRGVVPEQQGTTASELGARSTAFASGPVTRGEVAAAGSQPAAPKRELRAPGSRRFWFTGPRLAAAAVVVVAAGTFAIMQGRPGFERSSRDVAGTAPAAPTAAESAPSARDERDQSLAASAQASPDQARDAGSAAGARLTLADSFTPVPAAAPPRVAANVPQAAPSPQVGEQRGAREEREVAAREARAPGGALGRSGLAAESAARRRAAADDTARLAKASVRQPGVAAARVDTTTVSVFRSGKPEELSFAKSPAATGVIRGRVTDASGRPLPMAQVTLVDNASVTALADTSGSYTLGGVPAGMRRVRVLRAGYSSSERTASVTAGDTTRVDVTLPATSVALNETVVTASAQDRRDQAAPPRRAQGQAAPPATPPPAPAQAPAPTAGADAVRPGWFGGCYDLGITSSGSVTRTGFVEVPRRIALDSMPIHQRSDGTWHPVRDLAPRGGSVTSGIWRPSPPDGIELEWTYGSRTARLRLAGSPMLRGSIQEIDNVAVTGQAGSVVAVRRGC